MPNITSFSTELTMSSVEISELTGKRHDNVMSDIRKMLDDLDLDAPDFSGTQRYGNNNQRDIFQLPKELTITLVSGYKTKMRYAITKRWIELEDKTAMQNRLDAEMSLYSAQIAESNVRIEKANDEIQTIKLRGHLERCKLLGVAFDVNQYIDRQNLNIEQASVFREMAENMGVVIKELGGIELDHRSISKQLKLHGLGYSARDYNEFLREMGILQGTTITDYGKRWGFNHKQGDKTQPSWYDERFTELQDLVEEHLRRAE